MSVNLQTLTHPSLGTFFGGGGGGGIPSNAILDESNNPILDHNNDYILDES